MENFNNYVQGKCMDMCSKQEIKMREKEKLLHVLEMEPGTEKSKHPKASPNHMVKCFSRSAAGKQITVESLRPPEVLLKTVKYLICDVVTTKKIPWYQVYDFVTDRFMAIRQDMVVQNIPKVESIMILQPIVRFHAYAAYKLCDHNIANFDPVLNNKHLQECLKKLLSIYDNYNYFMNSDSNIVCNDYVLNVRPEFEALYILFNLGNDEALRRVLSIPKKCKSIIVKSAMEISVCYKYGNFLRVCRKMRDLPPLLAATASLHLPEIRKKSFQIMSTAYNSKNLTFPTKILKEILLYGTTDELLQDCKYYNIKCDENSVHFMKQFDATKKAVSSRHEVFVDELCLERNVVNILLGI